MNSNPPRKPNLTLCYLCIAFGVLCILGAIFAAIVLKNGIIQRVGEPPRVDALSDGFRAQSIDRQIESTERDIELYKKILPDDPEAERRKIEEVFRKTNSKFDANNKLPFSENKAEKIKELEEKKRELIAKRDELIGKSRAKSMKPRTWEEFLEDYSLELFLPGVLPLGLLSLYLLRLVFGLKLSADNPFSLTDLDGKCILFVPFALVFSAFGFFLFVWILALIY